ncbi:hypothetical protein ACFQRB_00095 [Halobaculum litoreum]|uniref:Uncharacterized protein n=1 Tax=Halobaculum litoreum TaxID=3031998 RepID=A0ABD5XQN2_9EURY
MFGAAREYAVRVTAADGRGTETTWDPGDGGAHLGVDAGAAVRAFSLYDPREVAPFVAADPGARRRRRGTVPLLVDAPGRPAGSRSRRTPAGRPRRPRWTCRPGAD